MVHGNNHPPAAATNPVTPETTGLCRDCGARIIMPAFRAKGDTRCRHCGGRRLLWHPEIHALPIAHIDCDAFYATVEKRDQPALADRPVIVGGGRRGVVAACCYVARLYGVRSAMPMFQALDLCPEAVVIAPDMAKYQAASQAIHRLMLALTPLVEPLSLDEAFLDLNGTEALHQASPAQSLARLVQRMEREVGVSASIGLSHNKFLAKIASDLDKPRGFAIIGCAETLDFLAPRPVGLLWGVGKVLERRLTADGIRSIGDLRAYDERTLLRRYGSMGQRLYYLCRGIDSRPVTPDDPIKSLSAETTFRDDIASVTLLEEHLWPLCETVSRRLKQAGVAGRTVVLKLKTSEFRQLTRSRRLEQPTQLADTLFQTTLPLLRHEANGSTWFRLIGIGCADLVTACDSDSEDLLGTLPDYSSRNARAERAMDAVRSKLGVNAVRLGRGWPPKS